MPTNAKSTGAEQPLEARNQAIVSLSAGLDALETNAAPQKNRGLRVLKSFAPLAAIAFVLLVWQGAVALKLAPVWVLPSPAMVWTALVDQANQGILFESAFNSLRKGVQGFAISLIIATPIGIALGLNSALRAIARPLLTGLQQLPSVAWVPAAIIWFGLSDATIFAVVLLGAVPSIANGLISGIDQIPPLYMRAGKVLGARGWSSIRHIVIPAAWPGYLAGLEQGWAFAWRSLMAAELIAISPALGPGLGQMLDTGRQLGDMSLVLGSIIVIMIVGVLIERLVFSPIRQRTLRNRGLVVSR
jgi:NitT/TauT family transport system permease protein